MTDIDQLKALRREIDQIDDKMHDLLMKRADVVRNIGKAKGRTTADGNALRPAREAEILRRLVRRHSGPYPKRVLVRLWREMMSGFTAMQGPYSLAVLGEEGEQCHMGALAQAHFGSQTPLKIMASARRVIDAVRSGTASIGVLPLPRRDDEAPWWPHLSSTDPSAPRIVGRLPFAPENDGGVGIEALAIGVMPQEETGDDRCLFVVEAEDDIRLTGFERVLKSVGLDPVTTAVWADESKPEIWLYLAEIEGCISPGGNRAATLLEAMEGAIRIIPLGGYAVPLARDDMA